MGYVKSMLPDDWEDKQHDEQNDEEIWFTMSEQELNKAKYLCIGNKEVEAEWLPRWYGVPHAECAFTNEFKPAYAVHPDAIKQSNVICLSVLPDASTSSDYKQKLKELKLEKLLNGK